MFDNISVSSLIFDDPARKAVGLYAKLWDVVVPVEEIFGECIIVNDFLFIRIIYPRVNLHLECLRQTGLTYAIECIDKLYPLGL